MLAEDHACLSAPVQVVCSSTNLQPICEASDYDSHHVLSSRFARAMPWLGNWALKATIIPCSRAEMHITQAVSFVNSKLQITVYCKMAFKPKISIPYSQKFHRTKFSSSRRWRNQPLFWPWLELQSTHPRSFKYLVHWLGFWGSVGKIGVLNGWENALPMANARQWQRESWLKWHIKCMPVAPHFAITYSDVIFYKLKLISLNMKWYYFAITLFWNCHKWLQI